MLPALPHTIQHVLVNGALLPLVALDEPTLPFFIGASISMSSAPLLLLGCTVIWSVVTPLLAVNPKDTDKQP